MDDQVTTVAELRAWLRAWVAATTGLPAEQIADDRPLDEYGLSSRDAVALSGEIEEMLGRPLDPTIAYRHPSIAALAIHIIEGDTGEQDEAGFDLIHGADFETEIAVIGLATRFPGGANDRASFWELLTEGRIVTGDLPADRWDAFAADPEVARLMDELPTKGGYLADEYVKDFDTEFFKLAPREAAMTDPQQRLALELTWEALEDARIPASHLRGAPVGVFIGTSTNDYSLVVASDTSTADPYAITGTATSIIANRVSYFYDFRGPSVAVDTACSSSLVAVHQAVTALRLGQASVALAGGVNMLLAPAATLGFGLAGVLSTDGRIKAFASDADGISRAEGAGMLVLKRLSDARRDGDDVLAVIAGSAVNSDGHSNGLTAPNPDAQAAVLRRAYADAGIDPRDVDYVEAHGTGTLLGDPIEATALGRVLGLGRDEERPTLLGSAKNNFGHMESAAGIVGMAKAVLALRHGVLPPLAGFAGPNPYIDFARARLRPVTETTPLPRYSGRGVVGVSGFGFGGTNAHVVLTEAPVDGTAASPAPGVDTGEPVLLPLGASMPSRRRIAAADLADWLETQDGSTASLVDVARALSRRDEGRSRAVISAANRAEAVAGLRAVAAGTPAPAVVTCDAPDAEGAVWVFSGFGAQHRKMGKELYLEDPVFAEALDGVGALILDESGHDVVSMFLDDEVTYGVETAQIGIFAIQVALVRTLGTYGARPGAVIGHSMGEVAAAWAAGGLSLADAVRVICVRSRLMGEGEQAVSDEEAGAMALVEYSAAEVTELIAGHPDVFAGVEPSVYAAPTHTTVGGPRAAVEAVVALAEEQGRMGRLLQVRGAGHTAAVDPLLGELTAELYDVHPRPLEVPLYSSVHREAVHRRGDVVHDVHYWIECTRRPVWFTQAVAVAVGEGRTAFMELSPNPVALMSVAATVYGLGVTDPLLVHTLKRKESEPGELRSALAQLYVHGHPVDLAALLPRGGYADIPRTPFVRRRHWTAARGTGSGENRMPGAHVALPDGRHVWQVRADAAADVDALVAAAARAVLADVTVTAVHRRAETPAAGLLTTTLTRHPGGAALQVHAQPSGPDGVFVLLAEAVVTAGEPLPAYVPPTVTRAAETTVEISVVETDRWDAASGETVEARLRGIVAETMSYAVEDLPMEVPLLDLGLDSLMAVRIKNRVEHEFAIPELQLQAVRDASLADVARIVAFAVENRETVAELSRRQAAGEDVTAELQSLQATAPGAVAVLGTATPAEPVAEPAETVPNVAPRDASERLAFGTWVNVTGAAPAGILASLPTLDDAAYAALAARLGDRAGGTVGAADVRLARTIERLADLVRPLLEVEIEGLVRTLRARPEGSTAPAVFAFHPAGGSSSVYGPLTRRLPGDVPVYGLERQEGPLDERAAAYLPLIRELAAGRPYVLFGWSFGGALAYEVAHQLAAAGEGPALIGLLDLVRPSEQIPDTPEELHARWERYAAFATKTYGIDFPVPHELLDAQGEEGMLELLGGLLEEIDPAEYGLTSGVLEHQRASFVDNRILDTVDLSRWQNVTAPTVLYKAERMHDGAIELEPRYAHIDPDGGWGELRDDVEIVQLRGDHLTVVDEPEIATVAADLAGRIARLAVGD